MLKHWIWLASRKGIGTRGCASLLRLFGSAEKVYQLNKEQCLATDGFEQRWMETVLDKDMAYAEKVLTDCDNKGISILTYADAAYPERLRNIADPPVLLYYLGNLLDFDKEAVISVVGTRKCSAYGMLHAKQFSRMISASGGIVLSGGARGIDTVALQSALESAMPVACVLGCGLDITYPRENRRLFEDVCRHGCLLSEYPPGTPPLGTNFPPRNRILSGLSVGVLVVEAPVKSGALITAEFALEQGRDVYTIPGNIGAKSCEGNNNLLKQGAQLVMDGWEIMQNYIYQFPDKIVDGHSKEAIENTFMYRYGRVVPVYSPDLTGGTNDKKSIDNTGTSAYSGNGNPPKLTEDEEKVLNLLSGEPIHGDTLVAKTNIPSRRVMAALTMLQIKGLAEKCSGNYYVKK